MQIVHQRQCAIRRLRHSPNAVHAAPVARQPRGGWLLLSLLLMREPSLDASCTSPTATLSGFLRLRMTRAPSRHATGWMELARSLAERHAPWHTRVSFGRWEARERRESSLRGVAFIEEALGAAVVACLRVAVLRRLREMSTIRSTGVKEPQLLDDDVDQLTRDRLDRRSRPFCTNFELQVLSACSPAAEATRMGQGLREEAHAHANAHDETACDQMSVVERCLRGHDPCWGGRPDDRRSAPLLLSLYV